MIGFFSTIFSSANQNEKKKGVIKVRRLTPIRILHAHQLGLTFALISMFLAIPSFVSTYSIYPPTYVWLLLTILFTLGTLLGGFFVLIVTLSLILKITLSLIFPVFIQVFDTIIWKTFNYAALWYVAGYAFGALLALIYNYIAYFHTLYIGKMRVKVAFVFDLDQKFNIIKTPCKKEEHEDYRALNKKCKLYNYDLETEPEAPYTIAFIANPFIMKKTKVGDEYKIKFEKDPIIDNPELFLRSVDTALHSFEQDEVLGRPEIWSRVRIVAVFDEDWANVPDDEKENLALVQPLKYSVLIDGDLAENVLEPKDQMWESYQGIIQNRILNGKDLTPNMKHQIRTTLAETDVVFALSASPDYTRSTARFSDWGTKELEIPYDERKGEKEFEFEINLGEDSDSPGSQPEVITSYHDKYAIVPGRVALNVLGANARTYIHEFAHAMSSAINGAIVDEYFDKYQILNDGEDGESKSIGKAELESKAESSTSADEMPEPLKNRGLYILDDIFTEGNVRKPFYVNRLEREKSRNGMIKPIPKIFVRYNKARIYYSDLAHPSSEENWKGYFPERQSSSECCIMDREYGRYRFDKLISDFMYDRLITKVNRSPKEEETK